MLVNLTIKRDKVSKVIYLTGESSNVIKTTVKITVYTDIVVSYSLHAETADRLLVRSKQQAIIME